MSCSAVSSTLSAVRHPVSCADPRATTNPNCAQTSRPRAARLSLGLENDVDGRRAVLPCVNHPDYRAWKRAILEDLSSSYRFDGLLWGVERWGPLHQLIAGRNPACFCEHCEYLARYAGLDWLRVKAGYAALRSTVRARAGGGGPGPLRMFLTCPEILAWEATWTKAYLSLHRELYGAAKWLEPDREFGLGLWHYYFINPLFQAEWDLTEFSASSDYIRPILYHLPEGPRIKQHLGMLSSMFAGVAEDTLWRFLSESSVSGFRTSTRSPGSVCRPSTWRRVSRRCEGTAWRERGSSRESGWTSSSMALSGP